MNTRTYDAKVSWWTCAAYLGFMARCEQERPRMSTSYFSIIRFDLDGELAAPRKKRTGRAYPESEAA